MKKHSLLYIDDEKRNLSAFRNVFGDEFEVYVAESAREAFPLIEKHNIQLIVADQRMPEETGVQFLARVRMEYPFTVRTILTGYSDIEAVIEAINSSHIYYYFRKPWKEEELKLVLKNAIETLELSKANFNLTRDLSEALAELRRKADELEEQVSYRQDLVEKLERANRIKGEFLSVISHELRTPLNPIIGYSDLLMREHREEPTNSFLSVINRCGNDLLQLINGILEFLEVDRTSLTHAKERIDLSSLLSDLALVARSLLPKDRAIEIGTSVSVDGEPRREAPFLTGELLTIRQILHNLVSNACKFTDAGSVRIEADLITTSQPPRLRINVKDTGIGVDPKFHESIFEAFTQVDQSLSRRFDGLGLGLALCRRQATLLNGRLSVESSLGLGSVFTLDLPIALDKGAAVPVVEKPLPKLALKALVVDDNLQNCQVLDSMLRKLSCSARIATSAASALGVLEREVFDVVFIDLLMPEIDGFELARRIRNTMDVRCPLLVAVTADLSSGSKERAAASGIDEVLYKPLSLDALMNFLSVRS